MDAEYIDAVLNHYMVTALWSETDGAGDDLDSNWGVEDIDAGAVDTMRGQVTDFLALIERERPGVFDVMAETLWSDPGQVGHDFWLTRNGHGTGFWDRYYGDPGPGSATELGAFLAKWAKTYGGSHLYVGDDRKVHVE